MRGWLLLVLLFWVVPAGAEPVAKKLWVARARQGWVHSTGVWLKPPAGAKVSCQDDGLHIETEEYLVQLFAYPSEVDAQAMMEATRDASERTFPGLKFGTVQEYEKDGGVKAFAQEGTSDSIGFLLVRIKRTPSNLVLFSVMKSKQAQEATLSIMSSLRYPK
ncbi:hypothetical protein JST97_06935 [bacterium]|nr:hypothetical protein [bacterium]